MHGHQDPRLDQVIVGPSRSESFEQSKSEASYKKITQDPKLAESNPKLPTKRQLAEVVPDTFIPPAPEYIKQYVAWEKKHEAWEKNGKKGAKPRKPRKPRNRKSDPYYEFSGGKEGGAKGPGPFGGKYQIKYTVNSEGKAEPLKQETDEENIKIQPVLFKRETDYIGKEYKENANVGAVIAEFVGTRIMQGLCNDPDDLVGTVKLVAIDGKEIPDPTGNNIYIASFFEDNYKDLYKVMGEKSRPNALLNKASALFGRDSFKKLTVKGDKGEILIISDGNGNVVQIPHGIHGHLARSLLIGDYDVHTGNFGVVGTGSKRRLVRIDMGAALIGVDSKELSDYADMYESRSPVTCEYKVIPSGKQPVNNFTALPPEIRVNPSLAEALLESSKASVVKPIEDAMKEVDHYYGYEPIKKFAEYLGMEVQEYQVTSSQEYQVTSSNEEEKKKQEQEKERAKKQELIKKIKSFLITKLKARQQSLVMQAAEIEMNLLFSNNYASDSAFNEKFKKLVIKYPHYFLQSPNEWKFRDTTSNQSEKITRIKQEINKEEFEQLIVAIAEKDEKIIPATDVDTDFDPSLYEALLRRTKVKEDKEILESARWTLLEKIAALKIDDNDEKEKNKWMYRVANELVLICYEISKKKPNAQQKLEKTINRWATILRMIRKLRKDNQALADAIQEGFFFAASHTKNDKIIEFFSEIDHANPMNNSYTNSEQKSLQEKEREKLREEIKSKLEKIEYVDEEKEVVENSNATDSCSLRETPKVERKEQVNEKSKSEDTAPSGDGDKDVETQDKGKGKVNEDSDSEDIHEEVTKKDINDLKGTVESNDPEVHVTTGGDGDEDKDNSDNKSEDLSTRPTTTTTNPQLNNNEPRPNFFKRHWKKIAIGVGAFLLLGGLAAAGVVTFGAVPAFAAGIAVAVGVTTLAIGPTVAAAIGFSAIGVVSAAAGVVSGVGAGKTSDIIKKLRNRAAQAVIQSQQPPASRSGTTIGSSHRNTIVGPSQPQKTVSRSNSMIGSPSQSDSSDNIPSTPIRRTISVS